MQKRLILPVEIGNKMLGPLGQIQNRLKVHDLAAGRLDGGVLLGQELQIAKFLLGEDFLLLHAAASFYLLIWDCLLSLFHSFRQMARRFRKI